MEISKINSGDKITYLLSGRMDATTSPVLEAQLISALNEASEVELDFADLLYISSAGLRVLLTAQKTANSIKHILTIKNVAEEINDIFVMTGFSEILKIV